jgi:hypothetical protein
MRHGNFERASDQPSKDEDPLPTSVTYIVITYYNVKQKDLNLLDKFPHGMKQPRCLVRSSSTIRSPQILGCASRYFDDTSQLPGSAFMLQAK